MTLFVEGDVVRHPGYDAPCIALDPDLGEAGQMKLPCCYEALVLADAEDVYPAVEEECLCNLGFPCVRYVPIGHPVLSAAFGEEEEEY
jgi:hypothetical protein